MESLKAKGDDAFKSKMYATATTHYTAALVIAPRDIKLLNNRSGCYCNLNKYTEALDDAQKSTGIETNFRGYQRTGNAYMGLGKYDQAVMAFERAVDLNPGDVKLADNLKDAKRAAGSAQGASDAARSFDPNAAAKRHLFVDFGVIVCSALHVISMLAMPSMSMNLWKAAIMAFGYRQVLILTSPSGLGFKPFTREHFTKLTGHFSFQYLALCLFLTLTGSPPQLLLLMAMCIYVVGDIVAHRTYLGQPPFAQLKDKMDPWLDKYNVQKQQLVVQAAMGEVMTSVMFLLSGGGFMGMIAMWQFLKLRYTSDPQMKMAMGAVADGCGKLFYHRLCPAMIGNLFTKLKEVLHKMATGF